jgi:molecular chaperone DnaK (HSP70)
MNNPLGLSIGTTNLVAARAGSPPVTRRAVLTLFPHRAPEVGVGSENPALTEPGVVMGGYVERIGDPIPLVAADGSRYPASTLLVEALDAMILAAGTPNPPSALAIAVPAHWDAAMVGVLRDEMANKANLTPDGVPARLISDAVTALTALQADPGLPAHGVVALLDFGGTGTSITLARAGRNFEPVGRTLRYPEFSGDQIDQALLSRVLEDVARAGDVDSAGTAAVGSLTRLREQCRQAKERLSAETTTEFLVELPAYRSDSRLTRTELEDVIEGPLRDVIAELENLLERNRITGDALVAVATVGGGSAIPLITQRLSDHFGLPVVTTPYAAVSSAVGAALVAARGPDADAVTGIATASAEAAT